MINCKVYINRRRIIDFDEYTATFDDYQSYILGDGEFREFMKAYKTFVNLPTDSENKFTTYQNGKFLFIDCRRKLEDIKI